ncbi:hypothetical protein ILYODFUR_002762 [Ilyodon furcidens]|uniref:Uncharacterized protein n=1 Tax=Ilyodon furcidens TaxID=33524 RepID=A0ABV0TT41_9TELE
MCRDKRREGPYKQGGGVGRALMCFLPESRKAALLLFSNPSLTHLPPSWGNWKGGEPCTHLSLIHTNRWHMASTSESQQTGNKSLSSGRVPHYVLVIGQIPSSVSGEPVLWAT